MRTRSEFKPCTKCGVTKDRSAFYIQRGYPSGMCRPCYNVYQVDYRRRKRASQGKDHREVRDFLNELEDRLAQNTLYYREEILSLFLELMDERGILPRVAE